MLAKKMSIEGFKTVNAKFDISANIYFLNIENVIINGTDAKQKS